MTSNKEKSSKISPKIVIIILAIALATSIIANTVFFAFFIFGIGILPSGFLPFGNRSEYKVLTSCTYPRGPSSIRYKVTVESCCEGKDQSGMYAGYGYGVHVTVAKWNSRDEGTTLNRYGFHLGLLKDGKLTEDNVEFAVTDTHFYVDFKDVSDWLYPDKILTLSFNWPDMTLDTKDEELEEDESRVNIAIWVHKGWSDLNGYAPNIEGRDFNENPVSR